MGSKLKIITIYGLGHFYVDFICSFILSLMIFRSIDNLAQIAGLVVIYNVIAFGTQPFFGFLVDHYKKAKLSAIVGLSMATIGLILFQMPIISIILLGLGNAIFHVGGGVISLSLEPSKAKYPGIYVAPGAIGLFLGGLLGYLQIQSWIFVSIVVFVSMALIFAIKKIAVPKIKKLKEKNKNWVGTILLLLLISVCMRSLIGYSLNLEWKSLFILGLLLTVAIASGKFFGGILADKYGFMKVGIIGLVIAAPLLVFFQSAPLVVFIGAFCFNLVMPITLTALAEALPNYKGFAFGLTTLSLITGYLLFFLFKDLVVIGMTFTAIVIAINIVSLYFGLKKCKGVKK